MPRDTAGSENIVALLIQLQRARRFTIRMQSTLNRKADSYIVSIIARAPEFDHLSLKAKHGVAAELRKHIVADDAAKLPVTDSTAFQALAMSALMIRQMGEARAPIDAHRKDFEGQMKKLVRKLPVWAFLKAGQHPRLKLGQGFAEKGAAIIIGEAGDPGGYPVISALWNRLSIGTRDNVRQQRIAGKTQEETLRIGYKPERRAELWALADSMYKHQVAHADECPCLKCTEGKPTGDGPRPLFKAKKAYGDLFIAEYNKFRDQEKTHGHAFNHGRRMMFKACLLDFWQAWREAQSAAQLPALDSLRAHSIAAE